ALIDQDIVANLGGLADDDAHPMINEKTAADSRARMDFDPGEEARDFADNPAEELELVAPAPMGKAMEPDSMKAGVGKDDFERVARGGIVLERRLDILAHPFNKFHSALRKD